VHHLRFLNPARPILLAWLSLCLFAAPAAAQHWPDGPVALAGGRLLIAGDVSATYGSEDPGWFTYTDYESSTLRRVRAGLTTELRPSSRVAAVLELRTEPGAGVAAYAWYLRLTPWSSGLVDIQAGRIPPVFGTYARRAYPQDNPLIGDPLAYQYLTSARPDAVPATADELLRMRGRGWRTRYSVGDPAPEPGVPLVAASRWDTGVQVRIGRQALEGAAAWTVGTLSYPRVTDDNGGGQWSGRLVWRPSPAFAIGASAARGAWLADAVRDARPDVPAGSGTQQAVGLDSEASWGRWLVRGEIIANRWHVPALDAPTITDPLRSVSGYLEVKLRIRPRFYVAARGDALSFSTLAGSTRVDTWDANVTRAEVGAGFTIRRGLIVKASLMHNHRGGGAVRESLLGAGQVLFWF